MNQASAATVIASFGNLIRLRITVVIGVALCLFVLLDVNFSLLGPLAELVLFATAGLVLCFLKVRPDGRKNVDRLDDSLLRTWLHHIANFSDWLLALLSIGCCIYMLIAGADLGQRVGQYFTADLVVGAVGMVLVMEAARRSIGLALPILAGLFLLYAHESVAQLLPDQLFPHRGLDWQDIIGQSYLRSEGVFGQALGVMLRYVFLFVLFGAFLEASGATQYIIELTIRLFGRRSGGPAKVSVVASGLMGSLSGSAVANAATTGIFTIPLMKSTGFKPHHAAGIEAAASSGGALAPPVMGAGAYLMLDIINRDPPVQLLEILKAALIPALLYYFSLFLLVHFYARRNETRLSAESIAGGANEDRSEMAAPAATMRRTADFARTPAADGGAQSPEPSVKRATPPSSAEQPMSIFGMEGLTFFGALGLLMVFLLYGYSPFRAATLSLAFVLAMILVNPRHHVSRVQRVAGFVVWAALSAMAKATLPLAETWPDAVIFGIAGLLVVGLVGKAWRPLILEGLGTTARGGTPLIVAAACVGIIIALVSRTGIGTGVPAAIVPLAGENLFLGLVAIMFCSIILGMGLPSAVSYLLLATIIGPVFDDPERPLGVPILAAHLFIFYFGMMAMVTPPVALAGYATASIAGSKVMQTSFAAFRFSLVGFTLPFMFVYRPALCLMSSDGGPPLLGDVIYATLAAVLGIVALAAAMSGFLFHPLSWIARTILYTAAFCALFPDSLNLLGDHIQLLDVIGGGLLLTVTAFSYAKRYFEG